MEAVGDVRNETVGDLAEVVTLTGEHDLGTVGRVVDALTDAAATGRALIVDLCSTTFVDSSILGAILDARRAAIDTDRGFAVACSGSAEPVRRVLEVTGLVDELAVHPTREAALAALDSGAAREPG